MRFGIEHTVLVTVVLILVFVAGMHVARNAAIDGCLNYYQEMAYKDSRDLCPQIISGNKK